MRSEIFFFLQAQDTILPDWSFFPQRNDVAEILIDSSATLGRWWEGGVNFTNNLFYSFFAIEGSFVRAGVNFTNILRAAFSYESLLSSFSVLTL